MKVRDLMVRDVVSCTADTDLARAAEMMHLHNCGALPVVDASGRVYGMVTDRDICMGVAPRHLPPAHIAVREVMARPIHACGPDEEVASVLNLMRTHGVRRLPVIDDEGHLEGIVSVSDVVRADGHAGVPETVILDTLCVLSARGQRPVAAG
ncbi:MAG TPA: CBS domain-containing protein [Vicinamibacterales bacterium]|nr:CBS domain-containing protein [Vicinamibacterales bacterium]